MEIRKFLVVIGTRPEAIKLAPLVTELRGRVGARVSVCVTAQHRNLLDQVLEVFGIVPDYDLDIMQDAQDAATVLARVISRLGPVIRGERPDVVLVQGDTATACGAALASYYERVRLGHVEAGLRTGDLYAPWPEEGNRCVVGAVANYHFAPTKQSSDNLKACGVPAARIWVTGNTVVDSLFAVSKRIETDARFASRLQDQLPFVRPYRRVLLFTNHRRENFGSGLDSVFSAVSRIARRATDVDIVFPVHPNPVVVESANRLLAGLENVHLVRPVPYDQFVYLLNYASLIVSDSGGVQEEATALGKKVLLTRDKTERPEAVEAGAVEIVGTDTDRIVSRCLDLLTAADARSRAPGQVNTYGDGTASKQIADILLASPDP